MEPLLQRDSNADDVKKSFSLVQQLSRWFLSVLCVAFLLASFGIYQNKGNLTSTQVNNFDAITTVLPLLLGLSFFVSVTRRLPAHPSLDPELTA